MTHSKSYNVEPPAGPAAENLAMNMPTRDPAGMVAAWYNEIKDCGPFPGCATGAQGVVGHFTTMIWKGAKELGCATVPQGGEWYYICRYKAGDKLSSDTPNMNFPQGYSANVPAKTRSEAECQSGSGSTGTNTRPAMIIGVVFGCVALGGVVFALSRSFRRSGEDQPYVQIE